MATPDTSTLVADLIDRFHQRSPLRLWSLVITVYGDAITSRGGSLWLGTLLDLFEAMRINSGAVRAAMSRLASDGWIERHRNGRNSFYRLSEKGRRDFERAGRRIYASSPDDWSGGWLIGVLRSDDSGVRETARVEMKARGFGTLAPNVFVRPDTADAQAGEGLPDDIFLFTARTEEEVAAVRAMAAEAWPMEHLELAYGNLIAAYGDLPAALDRTPPSPLQAMIVRTLLIHDYRRIALQDPLFPADMLPLDWNGEEARALAGDLYRRLVPQSEAWLDDKGRAEDGDLPPPDAAFRKRFGGGA